MKEPARAIHDLSPSPSGLVLVISGHPRPKQSVRNFGRRFVAVTKVNPLTRAWARAVFNAASGAKLERGGALPGGPVRVSVEFRFPSPSQSRWGRAHVSRPDADNLCKLLGDELVRAGLLGDDSAIQWGRVVKVWAPPVSTGCSVLLETFNGSQSSLAHSCMTDTPGWLH